jgi:uroporphyrinogen decarboxylase
MERLPTEPAEVRALLKDYYGRPEAAPIIPHQRVEMALRHEEPDRVPFDFWAVPEAWAALRHYLDMDDAASSTTVYEAAALLTGEARDADVLRLLGVDCRWVRPDYVGPAPIVQKTAAITTPSAPTAAQYPTNSAPMRSTLAIPWPMS